MNPHTTRHRPSLFPSWLNNSKHMAYTTNILLFLLTAVIMENPTTNRWITYATMTTVYTIAHLVISSMVDTVLPVREEMTDTITTERRGSAAERKRRRIEHLVMGEERQAKRRREEEEQREKEKEEAQRECAKQFLKRSKPSFSTWHNVSKNVFCTLMHMVDTMSNVAQGISTKETWIRDEANPVSSSPVFQIEDVIEEEKEKEREREEKKIRLCAELLRTIICSVFIAWSQYFVGPNSPAWLWGLVRASMSDISTKSESLFGRHAIFFTTQIVMMAILFMIGSSSYSIVISAICVLCIYVLRLRHLEYAQDRMYTEQTVREFEKVAQLKTKLLSHISHELRSPLTSIIMVTEMAMTVDCSEEFKKENCRIIVHSANELLSMINDILDYGKLEGKKMHLHFKEIDPHKIMNENWTVMKKAMEMESDRKIDYIMGITENVPDKIRSDGIKLQQIFQNIIGNAIKFTNRGKVTAELDALTPSDIVQRHIESRGKYSVCFHPTAADDSILYELNLLPSVKATMAAQSKKPVSKIRDTYSSGFLLPEISEQVQDRLNSVKQRLSEEKRKLLVLSVSDTGIGIEGKTFQRLFTPFTQGDDSITREYGGTGLGLSISRELTDLMKGFILSYSTHGKGSKFFIVLPYIDISQAKKAALTHILPSSPSSPSTDTSDKESSSSPISPLNSCTAAYRRTTARISNDGGGVNPKSRVVCSPKAKKMFGHLRCLIADDQLMNRRVLHHALAQIGCSEDLIEFARDGREVVEMFLKGHKDKKPFHLCLLDIMMPHVDGFQACSTMREYEEREELEDNCKILMVSADVTRIEEAKNYGADSFVSKPFTTKLIRDELVEILDVKGDGMAVVGPNFHTVS